MNKTPIAAILTDTHLSEANAEVVKAIFRQAIIDAKKLGFKEVYHLGDIFHSRKGQPQEVLSVFDDILDEFESEGIVLIVIPGNHDRADYSSWKSFLKSYKKHPGIHLVTHFEIFKLSKDVELLMIPFFEDELYLEILKEGIQAGKSKGKLVLGTHIGIEGAVMNNMTPVQSTITPNHFKEFDTVLVGHYHDAQEISEGKIKYIGASLQHNFGESSNKGLTLLYDDLSIETISLQFPQYLSFEVNVNDVTIKDIEEIKKEKQQSGDFIRIILTGKESDIKSFNRQELLNAGIKVEMREDKIDRQELESRIEPFDASSLSHEFEVFCTKNELNINEGKKYFNKVIN